MNNEENAKQIVQAFIGSLKGLKLYPLEHPALGRQIQAFLNALRTVSRGQRPVSIGLLEGALIVDDLLLPADLQAADDLAGLLQRYELTGLQFDPGVTESELRTLLGLLHAQSRIAEPFTEILEASPLPHIHALSRDAKTETDEIEAPRAVYGRALKVVDNIFQDVRLGKIPSSTEAVNVMRDMVKLTIADPDTLFALSMLKDYDNYTFTHSVNVSVIALAVGRACGLNEEELRTLGLGALLHDLGKLKVAVEIITKPGKLTTEEFAEIQKHPGTGAALAEQMEGITPEVVDIVLGHHLRFDRSGYPQHARETSMGAMTEMTAIADTYDALTTLRAYQRPMTPRKATEKLKELAGTVLHPRFVEQFIDSLGPYPVGTLVRLDSNEIGLVVKVGEQDREAVRLKTLFDRDGARLAEPAVLELVGEDAGRIVGEVDPFSKGIEVTEYF